MAVAPLGKFIFLPLFLLLFYVGYGFRIRDGQVGSIEQHDSCTIGHGKCVDDTGGSQVTLGSLKKRTESFGGIRGRAASSGTRQPPVDAVQDKGDDEKLLEHGRNRVRIFSRRIIPVGKKFGEGDEEEEEDDDDDEEEAIVEDEDNGSEESGEVTIDVKKEEKEEEEEEDEDEDDDDSGDEADKKAVKKDSKWSFRGASKIPVESDEEDTKTKIHHKHVDSKKLKKSEDLKDDSLVESEEVEEKSETQLSENGDETEESKSVEETKKEDKPVVQRKLEKVRLADKERVRPIESPVIKVVREVKKVEENKIEKRVKIEEVEGKAEVQKPKLMKEVRTREKRVVEEEKKSDEKSGKISFPKKDEEKVVKEKEEEKVKTKSKEPEKIKEKETPVEKVKEKPEKKVEEKPEKKMKEKSEEKVTEKPEKKVEMKPEKKIKEKPKEKVKEKPEEKRPESQVKPKKESNISKKKPDKSNNQESSISLSELNDMILQLPNFVPNFTAVEDPVCQQHGKIFLRQLRGRKLWALQMLDSSGKIPSGLLRGNVNQLGDFDQCLGISSKIKIDDKKTIKIQGKYCLASIDIQAVIPETRVPVNLMQSRGFLRGNMRDSGHFVPKFTTINWAMCIPSACSEVDARNAIENGLSHLNSTSGVKFMVDVNPDMCYVEEKSQNYSKETIGVLYFYAMIICLVFIATVRDYIVVSEKVSYSERIIMSFSLRRTLKSLTKPMSPHSSDISCIHGIRALATIALYVGHKMIPTAGMPYSNRIVLTEIANNPMSSLLRVSLVYTDSFLLLSGVLSAFHMSRESTSRGEIRWFCRFIARVIRLTPSLLVVIFWYAYVMEHTGSGPQWNNIIKANADICKQNSWTNFFYIQNFFPFEEMCATHTHQLALDMQLSLLSSVLVFFLLIKPIIGILLIFFLLQVSATLRYFATINNNLSLVIFHGMSAKHLYKTANLTYALSLHRATPYLFGISLGVLLHYTGKNIKIYKIFVVFGWIIAALLASWSLFSPWKMARRDYVYDVEESAHYAVIGPVSWALALCWVIFACFTDHGGFINKFLSSYWLILFSRISYSVYLTQFAVFFYNVATTRYSSEFQVIKVMDPYEISMVIFVSTVLTLFLDIPMQEVKNVLMESTDLSLTQLSEDESKPEQRKSSKDHRKPSKTPEPGDYERTADQKKGNEGINYSEEEDPRWRLRKPNGKQRIFVRRSSKDEDMSHRNWGIKREDGPERRRSSSTQRIIYVDPDRAAREMTPRRSEEFKRERRSLSRPAESLKPYSSEEQKNSRRDRSSSRLSDRGYYREVDSSSRASTKSDRGRSPRLRKTPVRLISSGSDDEPLKIRAKSPRRPVERPRVSDEEDWEQELRIRRQKFRERKASEEQEAKVEKDDSTDLSRRSSAEGKIALLQGPTGTRVMDAWTVSKGPRVFLGSSQEPTDTEEESRYNRDFGEVPIPERRQSLESPEHEQAEFTFRNDVKTKTLMDLRQISAEDDGPREEESVGEMTPVPTGKLFKRESIIKSQASEEDPEYLLPERPKLVEQEQEHPFRKAWQMQKSRSEEDGPSAFAIKDVKAQSDNGQKKNDDKEDESSLPPSGPSEQTFHLIVEDVDSRNWPLSERSESQSTRSSEELDYDNEEEEIESSRQSKNDVDDYSRESTRSGVGGDSPKLDWPSEDEQFENYRRQKRRSEAWESDET